jgi:hypothetical protein
VKADKNQRLARMLNKCNHYSSFIYNSQTWPMVKMINMQKKNELVYIHNGILPSNKKEKNDIHNMKPPKYFARKKPDTKEYTLHYFTFMKKQQANQW